MCKVKFEVSFENIHKNCKKSAPKQIVLYQLSLKLFKTVNEQGFGLSTEQVCHYKSGNCFIILRKCRPQGIRGGGFSIRL